MPRRARARTRGQASSSAPILNLNGASWPGGQHQSRRWAKRRPRPGTFQPRGAGRCMGSLALAEQDQSNRRLRRPQHGATVRGHRVRHDVHVEAVGRRRRLLLVQVERPATQQLPLTKTARTQQHAARWPRGRGRRPRAPAPDGPRRPRSARRGGPRRHCPPVRASPPSLAARPAACGAAPRPRGPCAAASP